MILRSKNKNSGMGIVEIIVGVGIFVVAVVGLIGGIRFFLATGFSSMDSVKAEFLLDEGFEAVRTMRDNSYDPNIVDMIGSGAYHLTYLGSVWATSTTATLIDGRFARTVTLEQVRRDSNDDIVSSGGTVDPDTAEVTVDVSWNTRGSTTTKSVTGYITNLFE